MGAQQGQVGFGVLHRTTARSGIPLGVNQHMYLTLIQASIHSCNPFNTHKHIPPSLFLCQPTHPPTRYGVKYVYCWHGLPAYWGGVMPGAPSLSSISGASIVFPTPTDSIAEVEPALLWAPAVLAGEWRAGVSGSWVGMGEEQRGVSQLDAEGRQYTKAAGGCYPCTTAVWPTFRLSILLHACIRFLVPYAAACLIAIRLIPSRNSDTPPSLARLLSPVSRRCGHCGRPGRPVQRHARLPQQQRRGWRQGGLPGGGGPGGELPGGRPCSSAALPGRAGEQHRAALPWEPRHQLHVPLQRELLQVGAGAGGDGWVGEWSCEGGGGGVLVGTVTGVGRVHGAVLRGGWVALGRSLGHPTHGAHVTNGLGSHQSAPGCLMVRCCCVWPSLCWVTSAALIMSCCCCRAPHRGPHRLL